MPNETELRLRAALAEQKGLLDAITERCLNLAAELAMLRSSMAKKEKHAVPADSPSDS